VYLSERIGRLEKTSQRLEQDLRRRPTREELAEEEGLELDAVDRLLEIVQQPLSLDMPVGEDQRSTLGDLIEDEYALSADERAECHLLRETVEGALSTVSPREARVLHLRYGLVEDARQRTLKEVGRELGVSKERIRQIQRRALDKLRVYLN
jgi:RNA polymerase primary sigma factor